MRRLVGLNGEKADTVRTDGLDGVGMIRGEYLCRMASAWVDHPRANRFISEYVAAVAARFAPLPVWYRLADMETSEVRLLDTSATPIVEKTPMLGMRGLRRSIAVPQEFAAELAAIAPVAERHENLHLLLPFVTDATEVARALPAIESSGLGGRYGVMLETPAAIEGLSDLLDQGVRHFTFGLNDLRALVLGAYRGSPVEVHEHPALLSLIERAFRQLKAAGMERVVAGYLSRSLVDRLAGMGCDAVTVHYGSLKDVWPDEFGDLCGGVDLLSVKNGVRARLGDPPIEGALNPEPVPATAASRPRPGEEADILYWSTLSEGLEAEIAALPAVPSRGRVFEAGMRRLRALCARAPLPWPETPTAYATAAQAVAAERDARSTIAEAYEDMDAFWADAADQAGGSSDRTFWDVYEHGLRRQFEARLARVNGAPEAVLVNSGMSALALALQTLIDGPGLRIATSGRNYFETSELLQLLGEQCRAQIRRFDFSSVDIIESDVRAFAPDIVLFEPSINAPGGPRGVHINALFETLPGSAFICDNTAVGPQRTWFHSDAAPPRLPDHFLVVESLAKFFSRSCMGGVVYGRGPAIENVRLWARSTGQNLQGRALNALRPAELEHVGARMNLHARNLLVFRRALRSVAGRLNLLHDLGFDWRSGGDQAGPGCLVFLALAPSGAEPLAGRHRALVDAWQARAAEFGAGIRIRAGFGWDETAVRCYESGQLNQADAPEYIRISVGVEPLSRCEQIAHALVQAMEEVG